MIDKERGFKVKCFKPYPYYNITMKNKIIIKDEDGDIYTFGSIQEFLEHFKDVLKIEYQYMGEWV